MRITAETQTAEGKHIGPLENGRLCEEGWCYNLAYEKKEEEAKNRPNESCVN